MWQYHGDRLCRQTTADTASEAAGISDRIVSPGLNLHDLVWQCKVGPLSAAEEAAEKAG
ncbi:MAG: hypothetical protein ABW166_15185 [Sedimenticola sp.]